MTKFKDNTDSELHKELAAKRKSLRLFRFGITGSKIKDVKEGRNIRKDIARILTELNARKASGNK